MGPDSNGFIRQGDKAMRYQRKSSHLVAVTALATLLVFAASAVSVVGQAPPTPPAPIGYYVLDLYFPDQFRHEVWDAPKTKEFLSGFWLLKHSWNDKPEQFNAEDRNLQTRLKNRSVGTQIGAIYYVIKWEKIAHIELTFREADTGKVLEVQPLALCTECFWDWLPRPGTYFSWEGFTPNLREAVQNYMNQDITPMAGKLGNVDRSGTFSLRVTDASKQVFDLPLARASWHVNHFDGVSTPFRPEDSWEILPVR